jgi:hypothetical protein
MTDTEINYKQLCEELTNKINGYKEDWELMFKVIGKHKLWYDLPERFWDGFMEEYDDDDDEDEEK